MNKTLFFAVFAMLAFSAKAAVTTSADSILLTHGTESGQYVFHNPEEAIEYINNSGLSSLTLMVAPSVYWLDNPDDPAIRRNPHNSTAVPFAAEIRCDTLRIVGLSTDARDVVFAVNRGQTQGALGNYTMLHFIGKSIQASNITFGNYCNVDLDYPANPALNRSRRHDAIVQAQLGICEGTDRLYADNCRFISRLNLCPLVGARRSLYRNCYFECTDDALSGSGIYLGCRFTFYSGKPFYSTASTGAVFLDCDIHTLVEGTQYLTKMPGQVTMIDTRWTAEHPVTLRWTRDRSTIHCYQSGITLNGAPVTIDADRPDMSTDISKLPLLRAYKTGGIYNIPNLLAGDDNWDPLNMASAITENDLKLPVLIKLSLSKTALQARGDTIHIAAQPRLWGDYPSNIPLGNLTWSAPTTVNLISGGAVSANHLPVTSKALITCLAEYGLTGKSEINIAPHLLPAPAITSDPNITQRRHELTLNYGIDSSATGNDISRIVWLRDGEPVRQGKGLTGRTYPLSAADENCVISAMITPQRDTTDEGQAVSVAGVSITRSMLLGIPRQERSLSTSFEEIPIVTTRHGEKGRWNFDTFKPADTAEHDWTPDGSTGWYYGQGEDAATGIGLVQTTKGARLSYTPMRNGCKQMKVTLIAEPAKGPGQGFGSATGQYMDICIAYNPSILTGYSLRIERTPLHDRAVTFTLMKHQNGIASPISESIPSDCYRTPCHINIEIKGSLLTASAYTEASPQSVTDPSVRPTVTLSAKVTPPETSSLLIQHTGSAGTSATLLRNLNIEWK
ncbi:MAG: hypothetical protein J1E29_03995 [Duncaniella sp.]|nr:hypothetical protein [Duncaniella sp.]